MLKLIKQTVLGATQLADEHLTMVCDEVIRLGDTSISAILELEQHGMPQFFIHAVTTATNAPKNSVE